MNMSTSLLTIKEVSKTLKVTPQYTRKLIQEGKLSAIKLGSQWVVQSDEIENYLNQYNVLVEPDDHERASDSVPEIVALSFFSGAMGLDIGMEKGGIPALLACENNKSCRLTIERNKPEIALIGDINKYSADTILKYAKIPRGRKVDVIFGGPPCQAFSTAGARRALDDERGNVFLRYLDLIGEISPTYVVIENVRGLLSAPYPYKDIEKPIKGGALCIILDRLKELGYSVSFELYNAANFGAPQIRERVVIVAKYGDRKVPYLTPTHSEDGSFGLPNWRTLGDVISNMNESEQHGISFPEKRLKFYRMLKEGEYWKDLPPEMQIEAMGNNLKLGGGKTGFFRRLNFSRPSPTLVTNPAMPATDLCHPTKDRPLSTEEYARIQEFPDTWVIEGSVLEKYRQIGNAVPIKLGEAIARTLIADMKGETLPQYQDFAFSRYRNTNEISWQEHMNQQLKKERSQQIENHQLTFNFETAIAL